MSVPDCVFRADFLLFAADAEDTTAAEVDAMPATVLAVIAAIPVPEPTDRFSADGLVPLLGLLLPLLSYKV